MIILIVSKYNFPPGLLFHRARNPQTPSCSVPPCFTNRIIQFPLIPRSYCVCFPCSHLFPSRKKKKVESMPIERNVNFYCLVILKDFFSYLKKILFIIVVWIIGNIKINYEFSAKEITIQHIETGWCCRCSDKGNAVPRLNCPDIVLNHSSSTLWGGKTPLIVINCIPFRMQCHIAAGWANETHPYYQNRHISFCSTHSIRTVC